MRLFSSMIAKKYVGRGKYRYYMKKAYCPRCDFYKFVPVMQQRDPNDKCPSCKITLRHKWVEIDEPDYEEYYAKLREKPEIRCKYVGRKPRRHNKGVR